MFRLSKEVTAYLIGALIIFTAGFFIFNARQAKLSGSWKYVMMHDDESLYWIYAKAASRSFFGEANPFYYEESNQSQTLPYPVVTLVGQLSRLLNVNVLFFYPIWHIGMPFLLWASLFLCLWKIWGYPPGASASVSMIALLSTLFFRGQVSFTLFRFSRPGDSLWLLFIWLSLVMNWDRQKKSKLAILGWIIFLTLWLNHYLVILGTLVTILEAAWQWLIAKNKELARSLAEVFVAIILSVLSYFLYFKLVVSQSAWMHEFNMGKAEPFQWRDLEYYSIVLYTFICILVFLSKKIFEITLSKMDRLLLFVFLLEPIVVNIFWKPILRTEFLSHRYFYFTVQLLCLLGWFAEKIPQWIERKKFKNFDVVLAIVCVLTEIFIVLCPQTNFLIYAQPRTNPSGMMPSYSMNNSLMLLGVMPALYLIVWLIVRYKHIKAIVDNRFVVISLIAVLAVVGFYDFPSQLERTNRRFPFDGAYQWLKKHGEKNDVVLTIPAYRIWADYLLLYTNLRTYFHPNYGKYLSRNNEMHQYRVMFYGLLMMGQLNRVPIGGMQTTQQKVDCLRLNYILVDTSDRTLVPPVAEELNGLVREVYEDQNAILWKVK